MKIPTPAFWSTPSTVAERAEDEEELLMTVPVTGGC